MNKIFSQKFKQDMMVIQPGEYFISDEIIINTLLGTCVSVVLYCEEYKMGGMNHYMLPDSTSSHSEGSGRYGVYAMELLINEFVKKGIPRTKLTAKVFGGGKVLDTAGNSQHLHVGTKNVNFVLDYLEREKIPIIARDIGGEGGRKVYFFPWTGKVLVSRIRKTMDIVKKENRYEKDLEARPENRIVLFGQED